MKTKQNRAGKGDPTWALGSRPWDRWRIGDPAFPHCSAIAKSTGKQCLMPPSRGFTVCRLHGAHSGRGKIRQPTALREIRNKVASVVRVSERAELAKLAAAAALHPDVDKVFTREAPTLYEPDEAKAKIAIDQRLKAEISNSELQVQLALARQYRRDPPEVIEMNEMVARAERKARKRVKLTDGW